MTTILGIIIGVLVAGFGLYYFSKEKANPESRKIYGIAAAVGVVIAAVSLAMQLMAD